MESLVYDMNMEWCTYQFHLLKYNWLLWDVVTTLFFLHREKKWFCLTTLKVGRGQQIGKKEKFTLQTCSADSAGDTRTNTWIRLCGLTLSIWMSITLSMYFFFSYLSLMKISAAWSVSGRWKHSGKKASQSRLALAFPIS